LQDRYLPRSDQARKGADEPDARVAWHRLLQVSSRVLRELDRRLDHEHRMGVREFDVLITLDNAEDRRLRMTGLAEAVMLTSGGLTRMIGRLEDRGLVQREPDALDARGFHAVLTDAGRKQLARARVTHDAVLAELLGSRVARRDLDALERVLGQALGPDLRG
jgi:DNA-binding MarR family transcriptional regulator